MPPAKAYGDGILFRVSNYAYWMLALTIMFALSNVLLVPVLFLEQDVSNIVFFAGAALPLGPAVTALLYCMAKLAREKDLSPITDFLRAYRVNLVETLRFWVPVVVIVAIALADITYLQQSGSVFDGAVLAALVVLCVITALWLVNMFVIAAHFHFRTRDAARLAFYYLGKRPLATIGSAATLFVLGAAVVFTFDAATILLSCLFAFMILASSQTVVADIRDRFTVTDATAVAPTAVTATS